MARSGRVEGGDSKDDHPRSEMKRHQWCALVARDCGWAQIGLWKFCPLSLCNIEYSEAAAEAIKIFLYGVGSWPCIVWCLWSAKHIGAKTRTVRYYIQSDNLSVSNSKHKPTWVDAKLGRFEDDHQAKKLIAN